MSERIEEVRKTLDRRGLPEPQYIAWNEYRRSVSDLLERIDELERENERLQWRAVELSDEVRYLKGYAN